MIRHDGSRRHHYGQYGRVIEFEVARAILLIALVAWSILVLLPAIVIVASAGAGGPGTP